MTSVHLISFGYGHNPPPAEAHATIDVRHHFKDPHVNPALRYLTAEDPGVIAAVLLTPGIIEIIESVAYMARAFLSGPQPGPVTIAIGCVGGRHRSAAIAIHAARQLKAWDIPVILTHRDMDHPVIERLAPREVTPC
jgi:UPF0042 nucleotide-binding protein